jgi:iron complex outermembrane recepter protein
MRNKLSDAIKLANKRVILLGTATTIALASSVSIAQAATDSVEEVMVTGIRGALKNSVEIKRNSTAMVDAVSAEDVGKLPDADVGQSLGRIPGVSVGRAFGQGASVSIRGSDPQMTYTTLNGQSVASTGWYDQQAMDRSFNYSLLPSELIGGMDVYKSTQADLAEGGIGGTVIIKTRKPFDLDANTLVGSVKGSIGTVSDDVAPELSGLYSWKNDAETLGVLVAAAVSNGDYIRRGVESDSRWSADVAPTTFVQERERKALDINVQARPTDNIELGLHALSMELVGNNSNTSHYIFHAPNCTKRNTAVSSGFNPDGVCLASNTSAANATDAFIQTWARVGTMTSDSLAFNASYTGEGFKADFIHGMTSADGGTDLTTNYAYGPWTAGTSMPKWAGVIDATGKEISVRPSQSQDTNVGHFSPTTGPGGSWATTRGPNADEEVFTQLDFTFDLDLGAIKAFKTGIRATEHEFEKSTERSVFDAVATTVATSSLYRGSIAMGTPGWSSPKPNIDAMMANTLDNISGWVEERAGYGLLNEQNQSLYGMFTFEAEGVTGNFGLRYINSDVYAGGYALDGTPLAAGDVGQNAGWSKRKIKESADYSDVLPSANIRFDLNDDLVLRVSAAQAITRPNYENMFLGNQSGWQDQVAGNETVTLGDVGLSPMKSSQADIGLEYYYGDGNIASVTFFTKDISNFITTQTLINQQIGVVSPDSGLDSWTVNQYVNAGGGEIDGVELQVNHAFDNGFGVSANYTYANGNAPATSYQDNIGVYSLSSNHNANLVGYWETEEFSARAAYNWRSKYMVRETGWYGNRMHDAYGTLDLSFGWNISEMVNVSLEATNVLEQNDVQYGAAEVNTSVKDPLKAGYPAWSFMGEAVYKLGVNLKF